MKKKDWSLVILPLFFTWGLDRISKIWADTSVHGINFYGPLGFVLHHNHGAMLGLFSELPPVLRIVTLSTGGAFLLFTFGILQYLLPVRSLQLRTGMSILIGGILGNVTDRIIHGYVTDFILIGKMDSSTPAFNVADALQWVGYGMIAVALIRESDTLWPTENTRKNMWVNIKFQLRYCFMLMGIGLGFAVISGVFSYTFLRVTIIDLIGNNQRLLNHYLIPFALTFAAVSFAFTMVLFMVGRVLSARIAGPLYAFEKFLDDLLAGKSRALRLRSGDEFKHLEKLAARLNEAAFLSSAGRQPTTPVENPTTPGGDLGSVSAIGTTDLQIVSELPPEEALAALNHKEELLEMDAKVAGAAPHPLEKPNSLLTSRELPSNMPNAIAISLADGVPNRMMDNAVSNVLPISSAQSKWPEPPRSILPASGLASGSTSGLASGDSHVASVQNEKVKP